MMNWKRRLLRGFVAWGLGACASRPPCPETIRVEPGQVDFTRSEEVLLCGEASSPSWSEIPRAQQRLHLSTFLLARGYYQPEFLEEGTALVVRPGPRARLESLELEGWPKTAAPFPLRRFQGRRLDSALLNELEGRLKSELANSGFPCAELKLEAFPRENRARALITPGQRHVFPRPKEDAVEGLEAGFLRRYEPFELGETHDARLLALAERRIKGAGIVHDAVYLPQCRDDGFSLSARIFPGQANFLSFGVGFDNEELLIARGRFASQRLDSKGMGFEAIAFASFRKQSLETQLDAPFGAPSDRWAWFGSLGVRREDEPRYLLAAVSARAGLQKTFEHLYSTGKLRVGLLAERLWNLGGEGPPTAWALALESSWQQTSHLFEYFSGDPQRGWRLGLQSKSSFRALASTFTATQLQGRFEAYDILWESGQASFIGGLRGLLSTTAVARGEASDTVPAAYLAFLGGSRDLRGYDRQELPRSGRGALMTSYLGLEGRFTRAFFLEPLAFADLGSVGPGRRDDEIGVYSSLGGGLRWGSPFGVFRSTLARGQTLRARTDDTTPDHWQFYFSWGEEF